MPEIADKKSEASEVEATSVNQPECQVSEENAVVSETPRNDNPEAVSAAEQHAELQISSVSKEVSDPISGDRTDAQPIADGTEQSNLNEMNEDNGELEIKCKEQQDKINELEKTIKSLKDTAETEVFQRKVEIEARKKIYEHYDGLKDALFKQTQGANLSQTQILEIVKLFENARTDKDVKSVYEASQKLPYTETELETVKKRKADSERHLKEALKVNEDWDTSFKELEESKKKIEDELSNERKRLNDVSRNRDALQGQFDAVKSNLLSTQYDDLRKKIPELPDVLVEMGKKGGENMMTDVLLSAVLDLLVVMSVRKDGAFTDHVRSLYSALDGGFAATEHLCQALLRLGAALCAYWCSKGIIPAEVQNVLKKIACGLSDHEILKQNNLSLFVPDLASSFNVNSVRNIDGGKEVRRIYNWGLNNKDGVYSPAKVG